RTRRRMSARPGAAAGRAASRTAWEGRRRSSQLGPQPGCGEAPPAAWAFEDLDQEVAPIGVVHALRDQTIAQEEAIDRGPAQLLASELAVKGELDEDDVSLGGPPVHLRLEIG